jgi:hypothetical protein
VLVAVVLVAVVALVLTRGGDSDEGAEGGVAVVTTTTAISSTSVLPVESSVPPTVLAGVTGDLPGIRLELNTLERQSDEVVRLGFTLINANPTPFPFGDNFGTGRSVNGIHILDTANEQSLGTLTDESGACRCSSGLGELPPGGKMSLYAELGAPPADIGLVSVVVPHFPGVQKIRMS